MELSEEKKMWIITDVKEDEWHWFTWNVRQIANPLALHTIRDEKGNSLLQIAIIHNSYQIFKYLTSIDYPLELINNEGETALITAIISSPTLTGKYDDYFVNKLIKKGADVSVLFNSPYSSRFLLYAIEEDMVSVAKLLIESGADINAQNKNAETPLHLSLNCSESNDMELVGMLLAYGADASIRNVFGLTAFDESIRTSNKELQELLFLYTFDQYTEYAINGNVLIELAQENPSLFLQVYKNIVKVVLNDQFVLDHFGECIFTLETECLRVFIETFTEVLHYVFLHEYFNFAFYTYNINRKPCFIKNLYYMFNSILQQDMIYIISEAKSHQITARILGKSQTAMDLFAITELYCFMLSYGLNINEFDLSAVYRRFGYCELFKIMLHMDIHPIDYLEFRYRTDLDAFPTLCYNFNVDFQKLWYKGMKRDILLHYYNDPKLKKNCLGSRVDRIVNKAKSLPTIPLLVELARNCFRKYFVETFEISTPRRFYTLLKALPISPVHEKIITLETELY